MPLFFSAQNERELFRRVLRTVEVNGILPRFGFTFGSERRGFITQTRRHDIPYILKIDGFVYRGHVIVRSVAQSVRSTP